MRDVSPAEAHRDAWGLMYCWICCSTGWKEVGEDGREEQFGERRGDGDVRQD